MTPDPSMATRKEHGYAGSRIAAGLGTWRRALGREWAARRAIRALPVLIWSVPIGVLVGKSAGVTSGVAVVFLSALFWACWTLARLLKAPVLPQVAETLDLRASTRNRIASGLCFEHCGATGIFERAAIEDGRRVLAELTSQSVRADPVVWPGRQAAAAALLAILGLFIDVVPGTATTSQDAKPTSHTVALAPTDPHEESTPPPRTESSSRPVSNRLSEQEAGSARSASAVTPDQPGQPEQSEAGRTSTSQPVAGKGAASSAGSGKREGEPAQSQTADATKESNRRQSSKSGSREAGSPSDNAMPSGAGRSGGASYSVKHDWIKNIRAASNSQASADETESDGPEDDEVEDQQQRGGAQPAARDRNVAPSRQLGISGPKGPPGTGRGGPTPVKKSRGTAAMLLGVPTPELVEGQSRPGPVQRSFRRVTPPQQDDVSLDTPGPVSREPVLEIPTQRWDEREAGFVSDYLAALRQQSTDESIR